MKALVKTQPRTGIEMQDIAVPTCSATDVLIKVKKTAICGTDLHIYQWDAWAQETIHLPLILGHEFMGEVVEVGREAASYFKVGDRVSGEGHIPCNHCRNCRSGRANLCRHNISVGVTRQGAFAEYIAIPSVNAYPLSKHITDNQGAILDPLGNATHAALTFDLVGEDVLITGAGPVGIMAAEVAKHAGARFVVITDTNPYRLTLAEKLGVTLAVNPTQQNLKSVMHTLGMKEGFDVGLEMSGSPNAFNDMVAHMNHAGKIALLGFLPHQTAIDWNQIVMKGITIQGIYGRKMYDTWYKMSMMLQSGLHVEPIITHEFSCDDFQLAFNTFQSGQSGKIIMNW